MKHAAVKAFLKQTMGLDVASVGDSLIERATERRMAAQGITDASAYLERLEQDATELQALTDAVVVAETWFFRHTESFQALMKFAQARWSVAPNSSLRCLSVPCASGEEPYSIVMALREAGLPITKIRVDAFDISEVALAKARRAVYARNSFRNEDTGFRDIYFHKTAHGHTLSPEIVQRVTVEWGNLLAPDFCPGRGLYDVIFCRNLLIYFDSPTQQRAQGVLKRLLRPDGWLFVGPAETNLLSGGDFQSIDEASSFGFRKNLTPVPSASIATAGLRPSRKKPVILRTQPVPVSTAVSVAPLFVPPPVSTNARTQAEQGLSVARQKADAGLLNEAVKYCEAHLQQHGPSAPAYYLLGLTQDTLGNLDAAEALYRKTIYLEPQHHEALVHLGCLLEKNGDLEGARRLLGRARRAEKKGHA